MSETKRQPWMKWYPRDWRGDGALRMCSFAARGLWADLTGLMHDEGEPYGFLLINGRVPTSSQLARILGGSAREIEGLLAELAAAGVYDVGAGDVIVCRRMVRDKAKAEADRLNGKGGGNPKITPSDKPGVNPHDNGQDKAHIPYSTCQESPPNPPQAGGADASQGDGGKRPSRADGTNPRSTAKAREEARQREEAAAFAEARRAKWSPRLAEYRDTGLWQTAWGSEPWTGNSGCLVPPDMREAFTAIWRARQDAFALPDNLRRADQPVDEAAAIDAHYREITARRTA